MNNLLQLVVKKINFIITLFMIFLLSFITLGYGLYDENLANSGSVVLNEPGVIISDISVQSTNNTINVSTDSGRSFSDSTYYDTSNVKFSISKGSSSTITYVYTIKNQGSTKVTYTGYKFNNTSDISSLPVPYVEGISKGDTIEPYQSKKIYVTYYYNESVTSDKSVSYSNTFSFVSGSKTVDGDSISGNAYLVNYNETTKIATVKLNIDNKYDSSIRFSLTSSNDKVVLVDSSGNPYTYNISMNYNENSVYTIYLLYSGDSTDSTSIGALLHDGGNCLIGDAFVISNYSDSILNGADPVLGSDMIPVVINDEGKAVYASSSSKWYDYTNANWANAVILKSGVSYKVGDTINSSDIDSYFVWIPRYRYQLWNTTVTKASVSVPFNIKVVFESKDVSPSTGTSDGEYLTHPAFTNFNVNGLWVAKFEISGSSTDVNVLPNVVSLRSLTVGKLFTAMYNYDRTDDSHMMKNTEWGAITYLTYSVYGNKTEIYNNNNSKRLTGCGGTARNTASSSICTNAYGSVSIYHQSTSGNISGIFDMSGGSWEYLAAHVDGYLGKSGLDVSQYDSKYFDIYPADSGFDTYTYRILGDATGEMGPFTNHHTAWWNEFNRFVSSAYPWIARGAAYSETNSSGLSNSGSDTGGANSGGTARMVLAIS